jgi:delta14-sterol reductase
LKEEIGWPDDGIVGLFDAEVTLWVLAYYVLYLALQIFIPGQVVQGVPLACGGRHTYKFNSTLWTVFEEEYDYKLTYYMKHSDLAC